MSCYSYDKIIVFDLDETLGSFSELGALWDTLRIIYNAEPNHEHFFKVLDIFPSFLRPNILNILNALVHARRHGKCLGIILYTNNQGPKKWAKLISDYFDYKLKTKVFDLIINAYKVNGRIVEPNRTSHDKNYNDLMRCTNLPHNTRVCFIDDQYHTLSTESKVLYIPVDPYIHKPNVHYVAQTYHSYIKPNIPLNTFVDKMVGELGSTWQKKSSPLEEIGPSNFRLITGLETFLKNKLNHTRKKKKGSSNFTRKRRRRKKQSRRHL